MKGVSKFFEHPVLDAYLKLNLINSLVPTTLIPLGILMAVYSTMNKSDVQRGGFQLMSLTDPLIMDYMRTFNITELTALTLVPFALLLGKDAFEKVMNTYRKPSSTPVTKRRNANQKGGFADWANIPILDTYLKIQGNVNITPATLLPLGILVAVYYYIRGEKAPQSVQTGGEMPPFLQMESLTKYMNMMGISLLTPQTLLPFALILTKEAFDKYVMQNKKLLKSINEVLGDE